MRRCSAMSAVEPPPLLGGVGQLVESVGELDPATVELETLGDARIVGADARERRLARRVGMKDGGPPDPEARLDPLAEEATEDVRPAVVGATRRPEPLACDASISASRTAADRQAVVNVDPGVSAETRRAR